MPPSKRDKLDAIAFKGVLVKYTLTTRQYRIYNLRDRTVKHYSNVRFNESFKGGLICQTNGYNERYRLQDTESLLEIEEAEQPDGAQLQGETTRVQTPSSAEGVNDERESVLSEIVVRQPDPIDTARDMQTTRYGRTTQPPRRLAENTAYAMRVDYTPSEQITEPSSFTDAVTGQHSRQ